MARSQVTILLTFSRNAFMQPVLNPLIVSLFRSFSYCSNVHCSLITILNAVFCLETLFLIRSVTF